MNFEISEPRDFERLESCGICRITEHDEVVAILKIDMGSNVIRMERLCFRHLKELRGVVDAAVERLESK